MTAESGAPPRKSRAWWLAAGAVGVVVLAILVTVGPAVLSTAQRHLLPTYATAGDILLAMNDRLVSDVDDVHRLLTTLGEGRSVTLTVLRGQRVFDCEVTPLWRRHQ